MIPTFTPCILHLRPSLGTTAQTEPFYRPLYLRLLLDLVIFLVLIVGGCVYDRSQRAAIESMVESHRAKVAMREVSEGHIVR